MPRRADTIAVVIKLSVKATLACSGGTSCISIHNTILYHSKFLLIVLISVSAVKIPDIATELTPYPGNVVCPA